MTEEEFYEIIRLLFPNAQLKRYKRITTIIGNREYETSKEAEDLLQSFVEKELNRIIHRQTIKRHYKRIVSE